MKYRAAPIFIIVRPLEAMFAGSPLIDDPQQLKL